VMMMVIGVVFESLHVSRWYFFLTRLLLVTDFYDDYGC
jgi:hypothetical protein